MKKSGILTVLAGVAVLALSPAALAAEETGGCESFAWPLSTELQWMKAPDSEAVASGAKLPAPPAKAIAFSLEPMNAVTFPVAPTGRLKPNGDVYGGVLTFDGVGAPGLYQVTLQTGGWVDVIQNGKALKSTSHSGKSDCDGMRKSVRFNIGAGPVTIEFSNMKNDSIKFAIRHAD
jgi:hypothetical protein